MTKRWAVLGLGQKEFDIVARLWNYRGPKNDFLQRHLSKSEFNGIGRAALANILIPSRR